MARNETYIKRIERELRDFRGLFRRHRFFSLLLVSALAVYLLYPLFPRKETGPFIKDQVGGLFQNYGQQQSVTGSNRPTTKPARTVRITIEGNLEQISQIMPGLKTSMESISNDGSGVQLVGFEAKGKPPATESRLLHPTRQQPVH